MKTTIILLSALAAALVCEADDTNQKLVVTTNWVSRTNWVNAPSNYRIVNGEPQDANQPPWQSLTFEPSHYWNSSFRRYAESRVAGQKIGAEVRAAPYQPTELSPATKLFVLSSQTHASPLVSTVVSNVPLTAHDLLDGGAAGLSRRLTIRAFQVSARTNLNGFKVERISRHFDYGLPYVGKVPIATRTAMYTTNLLKTPAPLP